MEVLSLWVTRVLGNGRRTGCWKPEERMRGRGRRRLGMEGFGLLIYYCWVMLCSVGNGIVFLTGRRIFLGAFTLHIGTLAGTMFLDISGHRVKSLNLVDLSHMANILPHLCFEGIQPSASVYYNS
jgi:hypothetical protein